ncbi:MAG: DUF1292 domain-containing protein [Candidatus Sericytochromatia bacterium]
MSEQKFSKEGPQPRVVSLQNDQGESFDFAVLQSFEHEGGNYFLAMTESFPDQLVIIERQGDDLSLVLDEQRLLKLQAHLEKLSAEVQTVTVADEEGKEYNFQIVQELELDGKRYLLGLDVNGGTELVAFLATDDSVSIVTDEAVLAQLQAQMQAARVPNDDLRITLETENGETHEFMVVGQLEIHGKEYVIAASAMRSEELIALSFDGENLALITDQAENELVNQHLQQLSQAQEMHG